MTSGYTRTEAGTFYHGVPLSAEWTGTRHVKTAIGGMTTEPRRTDTMAWQNWKAYLDRQFAMIPALQEDVRGHYARR